MGPRGFDCWGDCMFMAGRKSSALFAAICWRLAAEKSGAFGFKLLVTPPELHEFAATLEGQVIDSVITLPGEDCIEPTDVSGPCWLNVVEVEYRAPDPTDPPDPPGAKLKLLL